MTLYDHLGAAPTASAMELRQAFRRAATAAHPDLHGEHSSARMAGINDAWAVLGDPVRRREYDQQMGIGSATVMTLLATLDTVTVTVTVDDARVTARPWLPPRTIRASAVNASDVTHVTDGTDATSPVRRRARWPLVLAAEMVAVGGLVVAAMLTQTVGPSSRDVLQPGDCVMLASDVTPSEVACGRGFDAVVERLVPFGTTCPDGTLSFPSRTSRACLVPVSAATP